MPRFIKRKQLDLKNKQAPKKSYGVQDNIVNIRKDDQLELSFDKIAVLLDGKNIIELDQIWVESRLIPDVAIEIPGLIKYIDNLTLVGISGYPSIYKNDSLKNIIPETFGDKISYKYIIKDVNNNIIDLKLTSGYVDPLSGILTFVNGNPIGISHNNPPKISCYQYIGKTALDTGIGGGNSSNIINDIQWQNAVIDFIDILPSLPIIGDRYIYSGTISITGPIITNNGDVINGTINIDDIIEWGEGSAGTNGIATKGWGVYKPTDGTFTSVTADSNTIYFWTLLNKWKSYQNEKTFPVEQELIPQDTFIKDVSYPHIISDTNILYNATPNTDWNLFINGVKINDSLYDFVFVNEINAIYNSTSGLSMNEIEFNGSYSLNLGDLVKITSNSNIIWRTVIDINGDKITYSGDVISIIDDANLYDYTTVIGNFPIKNSKILLKDGLTYDIESGNLCDNLSIHYVKPSDN